MEVRIIFKDATAEKCLRTPTMCTQRVACWLFGKEIGYLSTP